MKLEKLLISPQMVAQLPVTDLRHVVKEINDMRKAQSWISYERKRQRMIKISRI